MLAAPLAMWPCHPSPVTDRRVVQAKATGSSKPPAAITLRP